MQDPKNNTVPSSDQQTLPNTAPYSHYLYSAANNFPADSNRGPYGIMPHNMFPVNQWQQADGYQHASNMTGNLTTTASSDLTSTSSTITNNIPIMSVNSALVASSNLNAVPNCNSVANAIPPLYKTYKNPKFCFPLNEMVNKKVILSTCELYPPNPFQAHSESNFTLGTSMVFIRGFPENTTDDVVKEIFEKYGKVLIAEKTSNFYVVIYEFGFTRKIDEAWFLNGWEIKIENEDSGESCTGTLSIFFDEKDARAKGSVPPPLCSEKEILKISNQLTDIDLFPDALAILTVWLERGDCNKRNAPHFYSAIQKTNSHVTNLLSIKADLEEKVNNAREDLKGKIRSILAQLNDFKKVLEKALLQKVWDHLTKPQRKCIQFWMKEISDLKHQCSKELLCDRVEDEMEMSDEEALRSSNEDEEDELYALKQNVENELQCAEQAMKKINTEKEDTVRSLRSIIQKKCEVIQGNQAQVQNLKNLLQQNSDNKECTQDSVVDNQSEDSELESVNLNLEITESDARLIGLIGTFLNSHPFGASLDYIASYLDSVDSNIDARDAENLMKQMPSVFKEESVGIGFTFRKMWKFLGFEI